MKILIVTICLIISTTVYKKTLAAENDQINNYNLTLDNTQLNSENLFDRSSYIAKILNSSPKNPFNNEQKEYVREYLSKYQKKDAPQLFTNIVVYNLDSYDEIIRTLQSKENTEKGFSEKSAIFNALLLEPKFRRGIKNILLPSLEVVLGYKGADKMRLLEENRDALLGASKYFSTFIYEMANRDRPFLVDALTDLILLKDPEILNTLSEEMSRDVGVNAGGLFVMLLRHPNKELRDFARGVLEDKMQALKSKDKRSEAKTENLDAILHEFSYEFTDVEIEELLGSDFLNRYKERLQAITSKDCQPFRLDRKGGPYTFIRTRDQDGTGSCYAQAGVNLVDSWNLTHGGNYDPTSPYAVAIEQMSSSRKVEIKNNQLEQPFEGGYLPDVLKHIKKNGVCSGDFMSFRNEAMDEAAFFDALYRFHSSVYKTKRSKQVCAEFLSNLPKEFSSLFTDGEEILKLAKQYNYNTFLKKAFDCKIRKQIKLGNIKDERISSNKQFINKISKLFFKPDVHKTQPVGIGYCSAVLKSQDYELNRKVINKDCGLHASELIGQRQIGNKCYLLLNNSWGTECNSYTSKYDCENGRIWLPRDVLSRNVTHITYIE